MKRSNWKQSDHVDTVTLTLQADPLVEIELDAAEIEGLLKNLGELQAMMQPDYPADFKFGQNVSTVIDPCLVSEPDPIFHHNVLHIRDPRYGWLHYVIPRDTAKRLAAVLSSQANLQSIEPVSTLVN